MWAFGLNLLILIIWDSKNIIFTFLIFQLFLKSLLDSKFYDFFSFAGSQLDGATYLVVISFRSSSQKKLVAIIVQNIVKIRHILEFNGLTNR